MQITIRVRSIYGIETVYPACPAANLFAKIAGTKTLTPHALRDIAALGYEIKIEESDNQRILRKIHQLQTI